MNFRDLRFHLTHLPPRTDLTLFLLAEELKSEFFFSGLEHLGLHDCYYRPSFALAVLPLMGFPKATDELMDAYHALIRQRARLITDDRHVITRQALRVYMALTLLRQKKKTRDET